MPQSKVGQPPRRRGRPRQIMLLIPPYRTGARQVLAGIAQYANERTNWTFLSGQIFNLYRDVPAGWQGDGIIADSSLIENYEAMRERGVPVVSVRHAEACPAVLINSVRIGELAADHLMSLGLKQFGFFGRSAAKERLSVAYTDGKLDGFRHHLATQGLPCHVSRSYEIYNRRNTVLEGAGQRRLRKWLRDLPKPVGIFCEEDVAGRVLAHQCSQLQIAVPDDVAIVTGSYDDIICEMFSPSLSYVMASHLRQGYEAARLLDALMRGEPAPAEPIQIEPVGVSAHESSDMLAIAEPRVAAAIRFIRAAGPEPIQVQNVQEAVGLSRTALDNLFKQTLGRTVAEQIRRSRLDRAKRLLSTTDQPLSEVAARAGFNTVEYMSACFRREMQISPGAFRKRMGGHWSVAEPG